MDILSDHHCKTYHSRGKELNFLYQINSLQLCWFCYYKLLLWCHYDVTMMSLWCHTITYSKTSMACYVCLCHTHVMWVCARITTSTDKEVCLFSFPCNWSWLQLRKYELVCTSPKIPWPYSPHDVHKHESNSILTRYSVSCRVHNALSCSVWQDSNLKFKELKAQIGKEVNSLLVAPNAHSERLVQLFNP